ncbi:MAG: hypothetical protein FWG65_04660 [Turicibacter sp.]|nr:hypothetical protein [Turicibacter sp.]
MNNLMEYKGYYGSIEYSAEDGVFFGKLVNVRDLVLYEGEDLAALRLGFEYMVDDCLIWDEEEGRPPMQKFPEKLQEYLAEQSTAAPHAIPQLQPAEV